MTEDPIDRIVITSAEVLRPAPPVVRARAVPVWGRPGNTVIVLYAFGLAVLSAIEEAFKIQLGGVMTFFFNVIYFHYDLSRIRQCKLTGVWS
jgi:hypothetical protein